jgi:hypothetical protein
MVDPERHRALDLLASSRDGCPEALFLAHVFNEASIIALITAERTERARWH